MAHTTVDNRQGDPVLARKHAHRRATRQEVLHHLPGDITGISRHALRHQAMVTRENQQLRRHQLRRQRAQNPADLQRQRLQLSQRSGRFGLLVEFVLQRACQCGIGNVVHRFIDHGQANTFLLRHTLASRNLVPPVPDTVTQHAVMVLAGR